MNFRIDSFYALVFKEQCQPSANNFGFQTLFATASLWRSAVFNLQMVIATPVVFWRSFFKELVAPLSSREVLGF